MPPSDDVLPVLPISQDSAEMSRQTHTWINHCFIPSLREPWLATGVCFAHFSTQALRAENGPTKLPWVDLDWLIDISCRSQSWIFRQLPGVLPGRPWGLTQPPEAELDNHLGSCPACSHQMKSSVPGGLLAPRPRWGPPWEPGCPHTLCLQHLFPAAVLPLIVAGALETDFQLK